MAKRTTEKKPLCIVDAKCAWCGKANRTKVHRQRVNPTVQPEYEYSTTTERLLEGLGAEDGKENGDAGVAAQEAGEASEEAA